MAAPSDLLAEATHGTGLLTGLDRLRNVRRSRGWPTHTRLRPRACNAPKSSGAPVAARAHRRLQPGSALMARPCASASAASMRKDWKPSRTGIAQAAGPPTRPSRPPP